MKPISQEEYKYLMAKVCLGAYPSLSGMFFNVKMVSAFESVLDMSYKPDYDYYHDNILSRLLMNKPKCP